MSDTGEIVTAWIDTCFMAMGRERPYDFDMAIGVCLHWVAAGKVMALHDWKLELYGADEDMAIPGWPENEPRYQDVVKKTDFKFKALDKDGNFVRYLEHPAWR